MFVNKFIFSAAFFSNYSKKNYIVKYYFNFKQQFMLIHFKYNLIVLNFSSHYSSLQLKT